MTNITVDRVDPEGDLCRALVSGLAAMGADVRVDPTAENLIRSLPGNGGPFRARIEVQGLPNLLHEVVHVVLAGRLDDDHGIDYGQIPFDLARPDGRAVLWDELACCVVSCAYLDRQRWQVEAWFAEQIEIQPVFYGMEDAPHLFLQTVRDHARRFGDELDATLSRAYAGVARLARQGGADDALERPVRELRLGDLLDLS